MTLPSRGAADYTEWRRRYDAWLLYEVPRWRLEYAARAALAAAIFGWLRGGE